MLVDSTGLKPCIRSLYVVRAEGAGVRLELCGSSSARLIICFRISMQGSHQEMFTGAAKQSVLRMIHEARKPATSCF